MGALGPYNLHAPSTDSPCNAPDVTQTVPADDPVDLAMHLNVQEDIRADVAVSSRAAEIPALQMHHELLASAADAFESWALSYSC